MKDRPIPEKTRQAQLAVSDPETSAWVSANAGSGKTYVLAQRVIRLLLRGVPPGRILCLTFTKAAAAHMANQVLKTLRGWVALDDAALDRALEKFDGGAPSPEHRARARRLFATALETPGGLKVQTIHAFCDRVLHQFPFEAGVPAGFSVLEEAAEADLLRRAREGVLLEAARERKSDLGKALALAVSTDSDTKLADVFNEVVRARRKLLHLLEPDGLKRAEEAICGALSLRVGDTVAAVETGIFNGEFLPRSEWAGVAETLQAMEGNAAKCGTLLSLANTASSDDQAIEYYLKIFLTEEGQSKKEGQFGNKETRAKLPDLFSRLFSESERLRALAERRRAAQALERTCALNLLGRAMIARYEEMKRARGALDYDDLVGKTAVLLENQAAAWVHYKLDGGIDHILIDEAQDTSPEQWDVIRALTKEFFAGKGASDRRRTIFAVGDEKQSIFGFQGADPKSFDEMRSAFQRSVLEAGLDFQPGKLALSFRSADGIVKAVDRVFGEPAAFQGLSQPGNETRTVHEAIRSDAPALVEIWDPVQAPKGNADDVAWDAPLDSVGAESGSAMLAARIARAVKAWLNEPGILIGDPVTEELRRPNAGDIIVLVRSRGPLFDAILRELKQSGIAVAGADRLQLSEHIAVMDIAALCDALLLPSDDLALACALKSPLFGFTEQELYEIAYGRTGTLRESLQAAAGKSPKFAEASGNLSRWQREARSLRPFDFLSRLLGRDKGRERIIARLGEEAADALDELLAHALAYEAMETPSLAGFLIFLRRGGSQVKRDLEVESHAVRVMTVHGVKGLEAPIIVLADTTTAPDSRRHHPRLMPLTGGQFIWAAGEDCAAIEQARTEIERANEGEHRRLLYVALTRARDMLVVCGAQAANAKELREDCWYSLVRRALEQDKDDFKELSPPGYGFEEKIFRWRYRPASTTARVEVKREEKIAEPGWLREPLSLSVRAEAQVNPAASGAKQESAAARAEARRRGVLIHRLLQELPRFAAGEREARAKRFLDRAARDLASSSCEAITAEALRVLRSPELSELFGSSSRAEVPIFGKWNSGDKPFEEFGRVDRFAVTPSEILLADFKSDAVPPLTAANTPKVYLQQLARYRAVLARLYPGKAMRVFLIWTANGAIHEIPQMLLDEAFARLTAA